jgi:hypothetical protein
VGRGEPERREEGRYFCVGILLEMFIQPGKERVANSRGGIHIVALRASLAVQMELQRQT